MTKKKGTRAFPFFVFHIGEIHGARGETRTLTLLRAEDFESSASTIPPLGHFVGRRRNRRETTGRELSRFSRAIATGREKTALQKSSDYPYPN